MRGLTMSGTPQPGATSRLPTAGTSIVRLSVPPGKILGTSCDDLHSPKVSLEFESTRHLLYIAEEELVIQIAGNARLQGRMLIEELLHNGDCGHAPLATARLDPALTSFVLHSAHAC